MLQDLLVEEYQYRVPRWFSGKESACQCRIHGFDPWVRKIPWRRKRQPHSNILAWEIPWTEEPGRLQSMGSQRVRHDLATKQQQYELLVVACGILIPWPGMEPGPPTLGVQSLSHWTTREVTNGCWKSRKMKSPLPHHPPGLWWEGDKHQFYLRSSRTLVFSALSLCSFHFLKRPSSLEIESKMYVSNRPRGECQFCLVYLSCESLENNLTSPSLSFPICEVGAIPPEKGQG